MKQNNPIIKILSGILVFGFTAIFSAVFFGSIDYIGTVSAESSTSSLEVSIAPNVAISIIDNNGIENLVSLNITPSANGVFSSASTNITASTTNGTGYTITMSDVDNDTNLVHEDTTITTNNTIPTLTSQTDESSFPTNYYGYNFNNTTITGTTDLAYLPIPSLSTPTTLITTDSQGNATYPFTVATKVDTSLPAGTYKDTITFSITANYVPQNPLQSISTMQEMTPAVCNAATIGDKATLKDVRDNNTYTVRKMEDDKCWMTQNLRLGTNPDGTTITSDLTITSADSNVVSAFTMPVSAIQISGDTNWLDIYASEGSTNTVRIYDSGNSWIQPTSSGNASIVNTSGVPPSQSQYIGNYYNWYTATAGTGTYAMTDGVEATSSICPKGWKLPSSGSPTADFNLLTQSLVQVSVNTSNIPDKSFIMQSAPNHFISSGYYMAGLKLQGTMGIWHSRTTSNDSGVDQRYRFDLALGVGDQLNNIGQVINPQGFMLKFHGASIRCLAQ